ncbi:hypothetical protein NMG60_11004216 [Bertholletia excelsa]
MAEIDTKSIESVQTSLTLFGKKSDQRKSRSTTNSDEKKERELKDLLRELANQKVQLEAKDSAYREALLEVDYYQKMVNELATQLKKSEFERTTCVNECRQSRTHVEELGCKIREMSDQLSETIKIKAQLSLVTNELRTTQAEARGMESELCSARDAKVEALKHAELVEIELRMEKEKIGELLRHIAELNEAEKRKSAMLSEKEAEIELAKSKALDAEKRLQYMRKELEAMQDLENQLVAKSLSIDSLQVELQQAKELSSEKASSDAIIEFTQLKADLGQQQRKNADQLEYIESLERELSQYKLEFEHATEEVHQLSSDVGNIRGELEKLKDEKEKITEREKAAQIEITMLKSELHKGTSKTEASEAAEARAKNEKTGLHLAVQQLALEAEEAKKEYQRLKDENSVTAETQCDDSCQEVQLPQITEPEVETEEWRDADCIMMTKEEYEFLIKRAEKADQAPQPVHENTHKLEVLKKELEAATAKVGEFRARAVQAISRAEAAENAKVKLEGQIRKWRERREKRKAGLAALHDEPYLKEISSFTYEEPPEIYQPLAEYLNIDF